MKKYLLLLLSFLVILPLWGQKKEKRKSKNNPKVKVVIIGATGSLARVVTKRLEKEKNISLTLFARNIKNLSKKHRRLQGNALRINDIRRAVKGQDIVYVNLAGDLDTMSQNIIKAMKQEKVQRIIAISYIGIFDENITETLKPYRYISDNIESSGLTYTILRPSYFTYGKEIDYQIIPKGQPETGRDVSRKSIAEFINIIIQNPERFQNENLAISRPYAQKVKQ